MTDHPDDRTPEEPTGGSDGAQPRLDEDAAWAEIVANYGDLPVVEDEHSDVSKPAAEPEKPVETDPFDRTYLDAQLARQSRETPELNTAASWDDEGHFVPPPPPPLPAVEPRRKLAWGGLLAGPLVALLSFVLSVRVPDWAVVGLVLGFVGGFVYLVATMKASRDEGWPGDDGAVL
jgi:hypothetical protein